MKKIKITNKTYDLFSNDIGDSATGFDPHLWVRVALEKGGKVSYVKGNKGLMTNASNVQF